MGLFSGIFGSSPSTKTDPTTVLTPEQEAALKSIFGEIGLNAPGGANNVSSFPGDLSVEGNFGELTSLEALEQAVLGKATGETQKLFTDSLNELISNKGNVTDFTDFFEKSVRDPALQSFEEKVLPAIGRDFGGADFFSSDRVKQDQFAREDLIDSLTGSRSELAFRSQESANDRLLAALGLAESGQNSRINQIAQLFGAQFQAEGANVGLDERNVSREFGSFQADRDERNTRIRQLLAAIGLPAFENIVTTSGGSSGIFDSFISEFGGAAGANLGGKIGD